VALAEEALDNRNKQDSLFPGDEGYRVLHRDLIADSANNVLGINTDWQEATINKNAPVANYNLGVSGGTENANYFFHSATLTRKRLQKDGIYNVILFAQILIIKSEAG
jgi:hypothetical protein